MLGPFISGRGAIKKTVFAAANDAGYGIRTRELLRDGILVSHILLYKREIATNIHLKTCFVSLLESQYPYADTWPWSLCYYVSSIAGGNRHHSQITIIDAGVCLPKTLNSAGLGKFRPLLEMLNVCSTLPGPIFGPNQYRTYCLPIDLQWRPDLEVRSQNLLHIPSE